MKSKKNGMRNCTQALSRTHLIEGHVFDYLRNHGKSQRAYAADVVEIYERLPENQRDITFKHSDDIYTDMTRNAEKIMRYFGDDCRLPCDLEDALVLALPDKERSYLEADLAARRGLYVITAEGGNIDRQAMLKEVGEAITASAGDDVDVKIKEYREAGGAFLARADALEAEKSARITGG